jgi:predicted DNA-binding transcriptional regulator AlpA
VLCRSHFALLAQPTRNEVIQDISSKPKAPRHPPTNLADVAFLDISDVCATARMSASWIHDEVRAGRFPQPMRFSPRCSRWRSADVRDWLIARAAAGEADTETAAFMKARAKKASNAAQAKRQAAAGSAAGTSA